jgi:ferredoxin, 2Fe-2S
MTTVHWPAWQAHCHGVEGATLLDIALEDDLPLPHACGGDAVCSTCAVEILEGEGFISIMEDQEAETLNKLLPHRSPTTRLACQARVMKSGDGLVSVRLLLPSCSESL